MWGGVNEGLRLATRLVECVTKSWRYASSIGCEGGGAEENRKSERCRHQGWRRAAWGVRARVRQRASASSTPRTGRLALVARAALRLRRGEVGHPLPRAGRLAPGVWRRQLGVDDVVGHLQEEVEAVGGGGDGGGGGGGGDGGGGGAAAGLLELEAELREVVQHLDRRAPAEAKGRASAEAGGTEATRGRRRLWRSLGARLVGGRARARQLELERGHRARAEQRGRRLEHLRSRTRQWRWRWGRMGTSMEAAAVAQGRRAGGGSAGGAGQGAVGGEGGGEGGACGS